MARQTTVTLLDDLDGSEAEGTIEFDLDRKGPYEIDLSTDNINKLREILAPYLAAARKVQTGPARRYGETTTRTAPTAADRELNQAKREWLRSHGWAVADRGRLSKELEDAYENQRSAPADLTTSSTSDDVSASTAVEEKPKRTRKAKSEGNVTSVEFSGAKASGE